VLEFRAEEVQIIEQALLGTADTEAVDEVEDDRGLVGVIGLQNCTIRNSRLHRIGIVGTREQIKQWRAGFGLTP